MKYIFHKKLGEDGYKKSNTILIIEIGFIVEILAVLSFIFRNIIQLILIPFDNM